MKDEKIINHPLDIPFKEFMPGQLIQSQQFNDDMKDIETKVNETKDKHNSLVEKVYGHIENKDNPHEVDAEQVGAYKKEDVDGFVDDLKDGNFNDGVITNRVLSDGCVDNRVIANGAVTNSKVDPELGSQINISKNIEITDRYTKEETDELIHSKVGEGAYSKEEIDQKFEEYQAGQIVDGTIGVEKLKKDVGQKLDISVNPSITDRYNKAEVNKLISENGLPGDWGGLEEIIVPTPSSELGHLPIANVMTCGEFVTPKTSVLDIDVKEVLDARGEYDKLCERFDGFSLQLEHKVNKNHVNVIDFGAKGDGVKDDTLSIQNAIEYCLSSITKNNKPYPSGYIDTVVIPNGRYKITDTITTYPQIKIVCDGFVQFESYIANGSFLHLTYPTHLGDLLGCDYRGKSISADCGMLVTNKLYTGNGNTNGQYWGGENIGLDLGTYEKDLPLFSDKQMVARYIIENIQLVGFKTGMRINGSSHFMGRYNDIRVCFADTCVQVGEFLGQETGFSVENFSFNDCLFERSNNCVTWVRNAVGLVFNDCSFDFIRKSLMVAKYGQARRVLFNGGHIEKIAEYLYTTNYVLGYEGYNMNIKFNSVELHLKHNKLFNVNAGRCLVDFDNCVWIRDEYYTTSDVEPYVANNKKIGDSRTHITSRNLRTYYSNGNVLLGDNSNCFLDSGFALTTGSDLKNALPNHIKGFSLQSCEGVANGTYSLWGFGNPITGWDLDKQINFKIGSDVSYGNIILTTNDIKANSLNLSTNFLVRCNDFTSTSLEVTIKSYNMNRELLNTNTLLLDNKSKWGALHPGKWCLFSPFTDVGTYALPPTTCYITITYKFNSNNKNSTFAISGFSVEFL